MTRPVRVSSRTGPQIELALGVAGGAAQQRADARQHLFEMERLGDVVVGAGVEALHLVAPAVARGQHQHRHGAAGAAPGFQHRDAVHLGQADVEDHRVIGLGLAEIMALLAVEGAVDHVARVGQRGGELAVEVGIVLDHEETQGNSSRSARVDDLAAGRIDGRVRHFAIPGEHCQHVDEALLLAAQAGLDDLPAAAGARRRSAPSEPSGSPWPAEPPGRWKSRPAAPACSGRRTRRRRQARPRPSGTGQTRSGSAKMVANVRFMAVV